MSGPARAAAAGVVVAGNPQVEPAKDSDPAGMAEAFRFSATASGGVTDLMVYVDASSSASALVAGLYADSGGHPGALLTKGTLASPAGGSWNDVTVPQATATVGTIYWIAILGTGGTLALRDRCCGGGQPSETGATSALTTLPPSWATGTTYGDGPASVYTAPTSDQWNLAAVEVRP